MRLLSSLLFPDGSEQFTASTSYVSAKAQGSLTSSLGIPGIDWIDTLSLPVLAPGYIHYYPFLPQRTVTCDQILGEVLTGSVTASVMRVGMYRADTSLQPTTLVVDMGTFDTSTVGVKTSSFTAQTISPGRYLLAVLSSSSLPVMRGWSGNQGLVGVNPLLGASYTTALRSVKGSLSSFPSVPAPWDFLFSPTRFSYPLMMRYSYV